MEMAEDRGALCREASIEGVRFWRNRFLETEPVVVARLEAGLREMVVV
jgi:ESCRT-II complex subunit VPS36